MNQTIQLHGIQYEYATAIVSAMAAGLAIAPFITIIIKSVTLSANGQKTLTDALFEGIKSLLKPLKLASSFEFRCVLIVYTLTYAMSNTCHLIFDSIQLINSSMVKLLTTFAVNTTGSIFKDRAIAKRLGKVKDKPFPMTSSLLLFIRDILAMASAFTLPPLIATEFHTFFQLDYATALKIAQMISPMIVQFINTFIHLLALDFYNRQGKTFPQRINQVMQLYLPSLVVRVIGFTTAYGIAGNVNLQTQRLMREMFVRV